MARKLADILQDWLMTTLFALGLTLPMLYCLDMISFASGAVAVNLGVALLFALGRSGVRGSRLVWILIPVGVLGWGMLGGAADAVECIRGMVLQLSGDTSVMPLIGRRSAPVIGLVASLLAGMVSAKEAGGLPGLLVTVLGLLLLWFRGAKGGLLYALPGICAGLTRLAMSRSEGLRLRRVLPWLAALSLAACLLVPSGGVTVKPLKDTADTLRKQVTDRFFFTQPRSIFSLADLGWYPMGSSQLGGTPDPSEGLIMIVNTTRRTWLRGAVRDSYTGHAWEDTLGSHRYLWTSNSLRNTRDTLMDASLPKTGRLESGQVSVTMAHQSSSTLLVPQRVRQLSVNGDMVLYFNDASEVFITRDLKAGDSYTVEAPLMTAGDPGLKQLVQACAAVNDPNYQQVKRTYTALPSHLQQQVYELARNAAGTGSDYDRAMNIMNWLRQNCTYTMDVAQPDSRVDFVSSFLLTTREGYCTYFATAMTVMCRMVGIPARYVEGFLADPDANGQAWVTGMQGHAWTEVYLSGFGWLTFDATPQSSVSGSAPQASVVWVKQQTETATPAPTVTPEPTPAPTPAPTDAGEDENEDEDTPPEQDEPEDEDEDEPENEDEPEEKPQDPKAHIPWEWFAGGLLLVLLTAALWYRGFSTRPEEQAAHAKQEPDRCQIWLDALTDALQVMKMKRQPSESPMAWMTRLTGQGMPKQLMEVGALQTVLSYSRRVPTKRETAVAKRGYQGVLRCMNRRQRLLLRLKRLL